MHDKNASVRARIVRFQNERIVPAIYRQRIPLTIEAWEVPAEPVPFAAAAGQLYTPFAIGQAWGKPWGTTWFHVTGVVPADWSGEQGTRSEMLVDLGFTAGQSGFQAEGLVYSPAGRLIKAIEPYNTHVPIEGAALIDLYIEAASNPDVAAGGFTRPTVMGDIATAGTDPIYSLHYIDLALFDEPVWQLNQEVVALLGVVEQLPLTARAADIQLALENAVNLMDPQDISGTAQIGRAAIAAVLAAPAIASAHQITAIGHAHIDSAWLWPVRETIRKCARTFTNVLQLMDDCAEFKFACSSAQQYSWMKQYYPELFERIRVRVAEGRFIPVGGMWVESDTNMVSGEAMVRQFVAGKGFFLREFGVDPQEVWLPDSFGYSGALPQIVAAAGSKYFLTQKISWNESNLFPHSTFLWEGIDGTRVLTHFPPVNTYNSDLSAAELARAEKNYSEYGAANSSLAPFGYGNGGGGPTREMVASAAIHRSLEGSPTVEIAAPQRFFERAEAEYSDPPVWTGELYLEFHRGTYTSQARTKRGNRRSESLLREAELLASTAAIRVGYEYPADRLAAIWQTVLLQQFHDILPGTSIAWVYREAEAEYARIERELEQIISEAAASLAAGDASTGAGYSFNSAPFEIDGIPALGSGIAQRSGSVSLHRVGDGLVLTSNRARFELDGSGRISSAVDLGSGREAIAPTKLGAELQLFRDIPNQWEAWDIDLYYREHAEVLSGVDRIDVVEDSADRVSVRVDRSFGSSSLSQLFSLDCGSASLTITTTIDWHERQKLLKLAFPLDLRAERAASEIQFGHLYRATHENTSWDAARFETSAHRWVHVGEPGFGIAIANNTMYGHDITRQPRTGGGLTTLVRQSLLRAPLFPDPEADQGAHTFVSSLTIGAEIADAVEQGYRLNLPLRTIGAASGRPVLSVSNPAVVVEAVKLAEDGSGDLIVRFYESLGSRATATVLFDFAHGAVIETDLLERVIAEPTALVAADAGADAGASGRVTIAVRPFQLLTLRVSRG